MEPSHYFHEHLSQPLSRGVYQAVTIWTADPEPTRGVEYFSAYIQRKSISRAEESILWCNAPLRAHLILHPTEYMLLLILYHRKCLCQVLFLQYLIYPLSLRCIVQRIADTSESMLAWAQIWPCTGLHATQGHDPIPGHGEIAM